MLLAIGFWLLVAVLVLWALLDPFSRVSRALWEVLVPIINPVPVDLKSKFGEWAVVTGSTDGIGKAYARELASRGINLILISRTLERLEKTREEILSVNNQIQVKIITADFSKGQQVFKGIECELKDVPIGILVNNVGKQYSYPMVVGDVPEDELWDIINVNVGASTLMTRLVIPGMKKRGKGAIVNVSSGSELQPLPLMTVYAATKVYLKSFSEALRAEYEEFGITIQHLTPLFVNTKMNAFSDRLQVSSAFVPDATTYARSAVETLGKIDTSTGYWAHGIQNIFTLIPPVWMRTKIGKFMNETFRDDYFKQKTI
ncbi:inactive hydroxysteroid dehydrogenase-like protein 1 isoform X2 [Fopius arisanus]|nr:PREDICTED: inactive hydroxysteroid dehydrogenase-like protein 1 isoform X2 [Fopius arisanus]XP_011303688.1 PREDICTED: inactive hydroxysteroid dehydrogenase-like protein 1 isoform X2 [Fopius arisanus]XP_011303689.1 PREDICTED: inactive hydroxysteroid dehydrogenase-like protein 1 isoform X2 [Fopius arisanus]